MIKIIEEDLAPSRHHSLTVDIKLFDNEKYNPIHVGKVPVEDDSCMFLNDNSTYLMKQALQFHYDIVKLDRSRGYKGHRRGEETCMPSPFEWAELDAYKAEWPE